MTASTDRTLERLAERQEALTMNLELAARDIHDRSEAWEVRWRQISAALEQDAENIRALARIAEIHERRPSHLEGEPPQ